jgi:hypothetical protein
MLSPVSFIVDIGKRPSMLSLETKVIRNLKLPQLFKIIHQMINIGTFTINLCVILVMKYASDYGAGREIPRQLALQSKLNGRLSAT